MIKKVTKIKMSSSFINRIDKKIIIVYFLFIPIYKSSEEITDTM
jgi:hypothetical protein